MPIKLENFPPEKKKFSVKESRMTNRLMDVIEKISEQNLESGDGVEFFSFPEKYEDMYGEELLSYLKEKGVYTEFSPMEALAHATRLARDTGREKTVYIFLTEKDKDGNPFVISVEKPEENGTVLNGGSFTPTSTYRVWKMQILTRPQENKEE